MDITIILIFYITISIIIVKKYNDIITYKNKKYLTVYSRAGLNNRIQVLLSYLYRAKKEGKQLKIVWIPDDQCPDDYNNLFLPIKDVIIEYEYPYTKRCDYITCSKDNDEYINANYYALLKPIQLIQDELNSIKNKLNNNYIACHIRRTDAVNHIWYKKYITNDDDYMKFIDQYPKELKIYIATDCRDTQQKFIDIYGNRMVYKKIEKTNELRQTSLQDAVKDMYVCAGAKYFMRSFGTFSDTIEHLRNIK